MSHPRPCCLSENNQEWPVGGQPLLSRILVVQAWVLPPACSFLSSPQRDEDEPNEPVLFELGVAPALGVGGRHGGHDEPVGVKATLVNQVVRHCLCAQPGESQDVGFSIVEASGPGSGAFEAEIGFRAAAQYRNHELIQLPLCLIREPCAFRLERDLLERQGRQDHFLVVPIGVQRRHVAVGGELEAVVDGRRAGVQGRVLGGREDVLGFHAGHHAVQVQTRDGLAEEGPDALELEQALAHQVLHAHGAAVAADTRLRRGAEPAYLVAGRSHERPVGVAPRDDLRFGAGRIFKLHLERFEPGVVERLHLVVLAAHRLVGGEDDIQWHLHGVRPDEQVAAGVERDVHVRLPA